MRWAVRLLGPLLLVIVVVRIDDPAGILRAMAACDPLWLAGALLLNLVNVHLKVDRWRLLLAQRGIVYPRRRAWQSFLSSSFLALTTPARLGDALRVQHLRRDAGVPYAEGFATLLVDRLFDVYVLAGFVAFATTVHAAAMGLELSLLLGGALAAVVIGPPAMLLVPGLFGRRIRRFARTVFTAAGRSLPSAGAYTVATFVVTYLQGAMIAEAMGLALPFVDVVCLLAIASLLALLPISISGVGAREAYFALIFPSLGLSADQGIAFGLMVFAVVYLALTLLGFAAWQLSPKTPKEDPK